MQQYYNQDQVNWPRIVEINKFSLQVFHWLVYNHKISSLLAANILLGLPKFYTSKKILKRVNMKAFWLYFFKIIF